jgi:hypothetical protein
MLSGINPTVNEHCGSPVSIIDPQEAFRRGVKGGAIAPDRAHGLAEEAAAPFGAGANEAVLLALPRLPGLSDAYAAYETGRALRLIVQLFDQAGAPERVGRQFIDNVAGAVVIERMRGRTRAWGAADTVDMFAEMYARILGSDGPELERLRTTVMDYAVGAPPTRAAENGQVPWYRRRQVDPRG